MISPLAVRAARVEDVAAMARVVVRSWQETYRGLMRDEVLDDPGLVAFRERFWLAALTDERYRESRAAVAERDGEVIGVALAGPPDPPEPMVTAGMPRLIGMLESVELALSSGA